MIKIFKKSVSLGLSCDFKSYFGFYKLNFNIINIYTLMLKSILRMAIILLFIVMKGGIYK